MEWDDKLIEDAEEVSRLYTLKKDGVHGLDLQLQLTKEEEARFGEELSAFLKALYREGGNLTLSLFREGRTYRWWKEQEALHADTLAFILEEVDQKKFDEVEYLHTELDLKDPRKATARQFALSRLHPKYKSSEEEQKLQQNIFINIDPKVLESAAERIAKRNVVVIGEGPKE